MSRGDPVEFTRRVASDDHLQRVGNRIQKEPFEIGRPHCAGAGADMPVIIVLPNPGVGNHWRFDFIHVSFDGMPASMLTIMDGVTIYALGIITPGPHVLPFETTRWASGAPVNIQLTAAGPGVGSTIAVLGARVERDIYS